MCNGKCLENFILIYRDKTYVMIHVQVNLYLNFRQYSVCLLSWVLYIRFSQQCKQATIKAWKKPVFGHHQCLSYYIFDIHCVL